MALKALLDNLDGLNEAIQAEYTKTDDGKFRLNVEPVGGMALENVEGLKSTLGKVKRERDDFKSKVANFGDLDPDKARDALVKVEELSAIDPEKEADKLANKKVEAMKTQLAEKHAAELKTSIDKNDSLTHQLEGVMIDQAATKSIADRKGSIDLLLPHVRSQARLKTRDDGAFFVEVIDDHGNPRIGDSNGNAMTIDQLVESMSQSDAFARAFDGSGASGGGAASNSGSTANRGGAKTIRFDDQEAMSANIEDIAQGKVTVVE